MLLQVLPLCMRAGKCTRYTKEDDEFVLRSIEGVANGGGPLDRSGQVVLYNARAQHHSPVLPRLRRWLQKSASPPFRRYPWPACGKAFAQPCLMCAEARRRRTK